MRRMGGAAMMLTLTACAATPPAPDLAAIYSRAAAVDSQQRRPVVTIPGTLGSRLVDRDSGAVIWGGDTALSLDPDDPAAMRLIALPFGPPETPLRALRDGVRTDGVVRTANASLFGATVSLEIYSGIIETLIAGGYDFRETRAAEISDRTVNLDAFEFPYDWRRDIVEAAQDLAYFIERKRVQVEQERLRVFGRLTEPVRFDLVAHSMGALVARYYLMYGAQDLPADGGLPPLTWEGAQNVETVVFIAPPNAGAIGAFDLLVNGKSFGPFQPHYPAALLGAHVAPYQLMPRTRHRRVRGADGGAPLDLYDIETWRRNGWGLAGPDADPVLAALAPEIDDPEARRALGLAHLAKALQRAEQFHRAMDRAARYPETLDVYLVVGGGFSTPAGAIVDGDGSARIAEHEEGDGVVLRASSLLDERQGRPEDYRLRLDSPISGERSVLLLPFEHVELTSSPVFGDNLLFWLLEGERAADALNAPRGRDTGVAATLGRAVRGVATLLPGGGGAKARAAN